MSPSSKRAPHRRSRPDRQRPRRPPGAGRAEHAVFIEANSILYSAAGEFGLSLSDTSDIDGAIAIWDGETVRYRQESGPWKWWSYAKLFWKYGLAPYKTQNLVKEIVGRFLEMYNAPHFPSGR